MTERRPPDPLPDTPHAPGGAADPLADLLALVTERARSLSAPDAGEDAMGGLKEAVDALGRYLDILAFLRAARAPADEPAAAGSDPHAAPAGGPATDLADSPAGASSDPPQRDVAPPATGGPSAAEGDRHPTAAAAGTEPPPETDAEPATEDLVAIPAPVGQEPPAVPDPDAAGVADRDYPPFRDQLTGLHSREGFDAVAGGELKRCRRHGRVFSMLLFELAGLDDSGISRAASAILASIRESDLAGRRDAKVLSVALPETSPTEARVVAERILRQFEGTGAWGSWARLALVTHPTHGETLRHLLDASRVQLTLPTQRVLASAENGHWPG